MNRQRWRMVRNATSLPIMWSLPADSRMYKQQRMLLVLFILCGSCRHAPNEERRTLVVAYGADEFPLTLNKERLGRYPLNAGLCEPLVRLARDFTVTPALASRGERRGPNEVRFVLRSGVTFSDGTPLDAGAVAQTLAHATRTRIDYSSLSDSSVRIIDDTTLDVRPARVNRRLVDLIERRALVSYSKFAHISATRPRRALSTARRGARELRGRSVELRWRTGARPLDGYAARNCGVRAAGRRRSHGRLAGKGLRRQRGDPLVAFGAPWTATARVRRDQRCELRHLCARRAVVGRWDAPIGRGLPRRASRALPRMIVPMVNVGVVRMRV